MPVYKIKAKFEYEDTYEIAASNEEDAIEQAEKMICEDAVIWGEYKTIILDIDEPDGKEKTNGK